MLIDVEIALRLIDMQLGILDAEVAEIYNEIVAKEKSDK